MPSSSFTKTADQRIPVGISRCLLGEEVRYNGGHKLSRYCRDNLSAWFDFVDTCPEVEIGLPVPRDPMRLVNTDDGIRVLEIKNPEIDHTQALTILAENKKAELDQLCGFVFMQNSPSCGAFRVKTYHANGNSENTLGKGAFAKRVLELYPNLPVEEAGRLSDPVLRENFVTRVFLFQEWRQLKASEPTRAEIIGFHTNQKYLLMAKSQRHYKLAGKLLARAGKYSIPLLASRYEIILMDGMKRIGGRKGHTNALQHMQGYLKKVLTPEQKAELTDLVEAYRTGEVPLIAPLVLLRHYSRSASGYYQDQRILEPHPKELGLFNSI
jgi:uncharacterized protein YbgA (DUF1722 family)/uncharacterized protein YbbK (DUF523 family)